MRTPKKIWRGITRKLKNRKDTTTAKEAVIEESRNSNIPEEVEVKEIANADKAAEIDTQLCENINENGEDLNISQSTCETSEKAQNAPTETPNTSNGPSLAKIKPCDAVEEKSSFVGTALLAASVALYILNMPIVAVVGGIVGLACIGFALYNIINPNTKLEKVEDVEQPIIQSPSNPT